MVGEQLVELLLLLLARMARAERALVVPPKWRMGANIMQMMVNVDNISVGCFVYCTSLNPNLAVTFFFHALAIF